MPVNRSTSIPKALLCSSFGPIDQPLSESTPLSVVFQSWEGSEIESLKLPFAGRKQRSISSQSRSASVRRRKKSTKKHREKGPLAIGSVVGKYRIDELLGTGAFAAVYRATHLMLKMTVAIKILLPKVTRARPKLATQLCNEARFVARVDHPNVVRVHDVTHGEKITYLVMEHVEGETLLDRIRRKKQLSSQEVVQIGGEICSGLSAALDCGLIHRDIKPQNILLAESGIVKIIDLGLARCMAGSADSPDSPLSDSAIVGTPAYMSPEQILSPESVDFRTDFYSIAATLYHAAVGKPPVVARTIEEAKCCFANGVDPRRPEQSVPGFPTAVSDILMQMMARNRDERPASYEDLIEAFDALK